MKLSPAGNFKAVSRIRLLHPQAHICIQLPKQAVPDMAGSNILSLLPCQRTVIDHEIHGNGRLGNLLKGNCHRILRRAQGISDMNIRDTGNGHDRTDFRTWNLHAV